MPVNSGVFAPLLARGNATVRWRTVADVVKDFVGVGDRETIPPVGVLVLHPPPTTRLLAGLAHVPCWGADLTKEESFTQLVLSNAHRVSFHRWNSECKNQD